LKLTVEQVTEIAVRYMRKAGYVWTKILKVIPDEAKHKWKVYIDVGVVKKEVKIVEIDDERKRVTSYK
jgi:hypothetical protein